MTLQTPRFAMLADLAPVKARWARSDLPPLEVGIGINTGSMIIGNMGSKERFTYTVIGDEANLGARLEAPAHGVLGLLRRVGLGQAAREEELQEAAVVLEPVVAVELCPAFLGLQNLVETRRRHGSLG